jgi:putative transposase
MLPGDSRIYTGGERGLAEGYLLSLVIVYTTCYNSFTMNERTHSRHATYDIRYHFVFCPKFRRPVLAGAVGERLSALIPPIIEALGGRVLNLTVQPDHVHLFAEIPPTLAPRQVMHRVKGATSHQLRQEFPHLRSRLPSLWTRSYYVGTAGRVSAETIQRYIDEQRGT